MAFSTINKRADYFNPVLYTGNGAYGNGITGVGFQPDLVWIKKRNATADHEVYDAVRGTDKAIESNTNDVERTGVNLLHSFDADGFTVDDHGGINSNTNTFVSWNWKANGAGSANTDGSVDSTVSVNSTSKFSIVTWTGTGSVLTVGHGLGVAPTLMLIKKRTSSTGDWIVYHEAISAGGTKGIELTTGAENTVSGWFNDTVPTSSVFTTGTNGNIGENGADYVAYCFKDVPGYSKFGKYAGNSSTDGPFIYTGFKPELVIYKGSSGTGSADNWEMHTGATDLYNPMDTNIYPNLANAESAPGSTTDRLDFLANGFKIRTSGSDYNNSSAVYIYIAFGQPIISNSGIMTTAR